MINIIETSRELTKVEQYLLTMSDDIIPMKTVEDGTEIDVSAFIVFEDVKEDGETNRILTVLDESGKAYCTQSKTFENQLRSIAEITGYPVYIKKKSGVTKAGRDFVTCAMNIEKVK